jgi:poly(3-hydroxyalkanoate) synthetase
MKDNRKYCVWTLVNSEGKFISWTSKKKGRSWVIDTVQWIDYNQVKVGFHNYAYMTNKIEELKALGYDVNGVSVVDPH